MSLVVPFARISKTFKDPVVLVKELCAEVGKDSSELAVAELTVWRLFATVLAHGNTIEKSVVEKWLCDEVASASGDALYTGYADPDLVYKRLFLLVLTNHTAEAAALAADYQMWSDKLVLEIFQEDASNPMVRTTCRKVAENSTLSPNKRALYALLCSDAQICLANCDTWLQKVLVVLRCGNPLSDLEMLTADAFANTELIWLRKVFVGLATNSIDTVLVSRAAPNFCAYHNLLRVMVHIELCRFLYTHQKTHYGIQVIEYIRECVIPEVGSFAQVSSSYTEMLPENDCINLYTRVLPTITTENDRQALYDSAKKLHNQSPLEQGLLNLLHNVMIHASSNREDLINGLYLVRGFLSQFKSLTLIKHIAPVLIRVLDMQLSNNETTNDAEQTARIFDIHDLRSYETIDSMHITSVYYKSDDGHLLIQLLQQYYILIQAIREHYDYLETGVDVGGELHNTIIRAINTDVPEIQGSAAYQAFKNTKGKWIPKLVMQYISTLQRGAGDEAIQLTQSLVNKESLEGLSSTYLKFVAQLTLN